MAPRASRMRTVPKARQPVRIVPVFVERRNEIAAFREAGSRVRDVANAGQDGRLKGLWRRGYASRV